VTLADRRTELQLLVVIALGALLGLLSATHPGAAVGLLGVGLIAALVVLAPVANVILLLIFTAIVPYAVQNRFGVAGGSGAPGLLLSDLLLIFGMIRGVLAMAHRGADRRCIALAGAMLVFLLVAAVQLLHGVSAGHDVSQTGTEFRFLMGFGAVLLALPLVADPDSRRRLLAGLAITGLLLGAWGLFQWLFGVTFSSFGGDIGIREGVTYSSAKGQLQGGLYAFPVAVLVSFSVLLSGQLRSLRARITVLAILFLNTISLLLTYERTFWVATVAGVLFVVARGGRKVRARMLAVTPIVLIALFVGLSAVSPQTLPAARERLLSLGQYGSDPSVRYRITEANHVVVLVKEHFVTGSGLGAIVRWGRPYEQVPARDFIFSHNGYLWLTWKLGIIGAILLVGILSAAVLWRIRTPDGLYGSVALGAQGALVMALISSVTFPSFEFLSITAVMGVLLALCAAPLAHGAAMERRGRTARRPGSAVQERGSPAGLIRSPIA
jgi:O-antigen ligase